MTKALVSFSLAVFLSLPALATYQIAKTNQKSLEPEQIWPEEGHFCTNFVVALDALETLCEKHGGSVLLLHHVSSDGTTRVQKVIQFKNC